MPNMRIVSDNAGDRGTTTVGNSVGSFVAANLKNDIKSSVCRGSGDAVNLFSFPNDFDNAYWVKAGSPSYTANSEVAPDGTLTADVWSCNATGASVGFGKGIAVSGRYKQSIYFKNLSGGFSFRVGTSAQYITINTVTLAVVNYGAGSYSVTPAENGYTKVDVEMNSTLFSGGVIYHTSGSGNTGTIALWGASFVPVAQQSVSTTWTVAETINAVALPFCNLTPAATMRIRVSTETTKTNLLRYSEQLENGVWIQSGVTVAANNSVTAPDGTITFDKVLPTAVLSSFKELQNNFSIVAGQIYTFSMFVKASGYNYIQLIGGSSGFGTFYLNFDLSNGTESLFVAGTSTVIARGISSIGNGIYRVWVTATALITAGDRLTFNIIPAANSVRGVAWKGDGTSGVLCWGVQAEVGNLSSYYSTTSAASTRPTGYIDSWQSYDYDSTALACPAESIEVSGMTSLQSKSAYAYGGGAVARAYLPTTMSATGVRLDIVDSANEAGYIEASRLVIGEYWSPTINPPHGLSLSAQDTGKQLRTDGGDLLTDIGTRNKKLSVMLENMPIADRNPFMNIIRRCGLSKPMFISVYPEDSDLELERDYQLYGKFTTVPSNTLISFNAYQAPLEIEEV